MKKYQVKGKSAIFGQGMVLCLTDTQAQIRQENLSKTKRGYVVNTPVFFKNGEIIGIVEGNIPKNLLTILEETEVENTGKEQKKAGQSKKDVNASPKKE